jgi:hypothetical protein
MWLDDDEMPELVTVTVHTHMHIHTRICTHTRTHTHTTHHTQDTEEELDEMPALVEVHSTHWLQPMDTFRYYNWGYLHRREVERTLMLALGIKELVTLCVCYLV